MTSKDKTRQKLVDSIRKTKAAALPKPAAPAGTRRAASRRAEGRCRGSGSQPRRGPSPGVGHRSPLE